MTKSELIERLASQQSHIPAKAVEDAVKEMLEHMASTLAQGERIEIRGFGSFSLHYRAPRTGRNDPHHTGMIVTLCRAARQRPQGLEVESLPLPALTAMTRQMMRPA